MNKLIFVLLLFLSFNLFGQESVKSTDVKLYTSYDYIPKYVQFELDTANREIINYEREISAFNFSPAIVFYNKKGNSTEIELSRLRYTNSFNEEYSVYDSTGMVYNTISGKYEKQFELFLRYEYKVSLFKKKNWKTIRPIIGFSAMPFVSWNKTQPLLSTEFETSKTIMGIYLSVIPRIEYIISDRWYVDLNVPIAVSTSHYTIIKSEDPALDLNERVIEIMDYYNTPISFSIRLGLGFKI